jgi:glucan 1,3-beta-glucosidase
MQAAAGILLAAAIFGAAFLAGRGQAMPPFFWQRIVALSLLPAILFGWTVERVPIDSFDAGTWLRALAFALVAAAAPVVCAAACATGQVQPGFAALLGRTGGARGALDIAVGLTLIALTLLSVQTALALVFDPRYRDIPFAPQSGAVIAFVVLMVSTPRAQGQRAFAEAVAAAVLAVAAVYIGFNETLANWQATWLCAGLLGLAVILARARDAPG